MLQKISILICLGIWLLCTSLQGQVKHKLSIGTDLHYSNKSTNLLHSMQDRLWQLSLTYQWHKYLYSGLYGKLDKFEHKFNSGETETGQVNSAGPLMGGTLQLSSPLYFNSELGFTLGNGAYKPPVSSSINSHPDNEKLERDYRYSGLDVWLGFILRSVERLDVKLGVQYTWEYWKRRPLEGIHNPDYPLVSPKEKTFHFFRWKIGIHYRFSIFNKNG